MKEYVVGFAFDPTETFVALVLKNRPAWQAGRLNGVGGKLEKDEHSRTAMRREFREEAGDADVSWALFAILEGVDDMARVQDPEPFRVYFFRGIAEHIETRTDEPVAWFNAFELPPGALPNLLWLIPMARDRQRHDWPFQIRERA